jgi:formylglycine-generating enzyme required for sulfatase activity
VFIFPNDLPGVKMSTLTEKPAKRYHVTGWTDCGRIFEIMHLGCRLQHAARAINWWVRQLSPRRWNFAATLLIGIVLLAVFMGCAAQTPIPTTASDITPTPKTPLSITQKGAQMLLIPAGSFMMGSDNGDADEKPTHPVTLAAFYMDKYEVTNALYRDCVDSGACIAPRSTRSFTHSSYYGDPRFEQYPVVYVDWDMARTYCDWRGARLPSEAEWEYAASGQSDGRLYPWGDQDISCAKDATNSANFSGSDCEGDVLSVGSFPPNDYGLYDMSGNVWEWVADWYDMYPGGVQNSDFGQKYRVMRGGSWHRQPYDLRLTNRLRDIPGVSGSDLGFRCAR